MITGISVIQHRREQAVLGQDDTLAQRILLGESLLTEPPDCSVGRPSLHGRVHGQEDDVGRTCLHLSSSVVPHDEGQIDTGQIARDQSRAARRERPVDAIG